MQSRSTMGVGRAPVVAAGAGPGDDGAVPLDDFRALPSRGAVAADLYAASATAPAASVPLRVEPGSTGWADSCT